MKSVRGIRGHYLPACLVCVFGQIRYAKIIPHDIMVENLFRFTCMINCFLHFEFHQNLYKTPKGKQSIRRQNFLCQSKISLYYSVESGINTVILCPDLYADTTMLCQYKSLGIQFIMCFHRAPSGNLSNRLDP